MIPHLQDRAAALKLLGWTGRDAEWACPGLPAQRGFPARAVPRVRREPTRRTGGAVRRAVPRVVRREGRPQRSGRAGVGRVGAGVRGRAAVAVPGAGGRARAPPARGAADGAAAAAAVARLRARPPRGAVARDRGGEGLGADDGRGARGGAAAARVPGTAGLAQPLLRAQAAARPGGGAGDVRLRPGRGRDAERRPHVGRDARGAVGGVCARRGARSTSSWRAGTPSAWRRPSRCSPAGRRHPRLPAMPRRCARRGRSSRRSRRR